MRLAVWHDPPPGGALRALNEMVQQLAVRHEVDVFALAEHAGERRDQSGIGRIELAYHPHPHRRMGAYWNDWLTYLDLRALDEIERTIAERIDQRGYDVALVSVLRNGQAPGALRHLATPTAYYCHEPPRRFWEPWARPEAGPLSAYERTRRLWRRPAQALLDRLVQRRDWSNTRAAHAVVTNSEYTRSRIAMVYGREAAVCHPGVDAVFFRPPRSRSVPDPTSPTRFDGNADRPTVISVGALEAHKGFDFVVRALGRIPRDRRPRLVIVGGGGHPRMAGSLQSLAAAFDVELEVAIGLSDDELLVRYQSSQLFVFGAHYEPFGMVLLEAMACGLPVVAVDEGGVRESVVEGVSGLVVRRDEDAFAAAVDSLIGDPDRRLAMGNAARRLAEPRSWETAAVCLERNLDQVAASRNTSRAAVV